jgi:hypothetical protein
MQGTGTEESGVKDGEEEGCYCPNSEKIVICRKNTAIYSLIVSPTDI